MKKNYFAPETLIENIELQGIVCTSGVGGAADGPGSDIGYGGVDEGGTKDPSARRRRNEWDDEAEEDTW